MSPVHASVPTELPTLDLPRLLRELAEQFEDGTCVEAQVEVDLRVRIDPEGRAHLVRYALTLDVLADLRWAGSRRGPVD